MPIIEESIIQNKHNNVKLSVVSDQIGHLDKGPNCLTEML